MVFSGTTAKASLISHRSTSSTDMPALVIALRLAGVGAVSMITGSAPTVATEITRARGFSPWALAYSGEATSTAPAPSTMPLELPAWCTWSILPAWG